MTFDAPDSRTFTPSSDVLVREIGDEAVLLDLRTERYLGLDGVGRVIWAELSRGGSAEVAVQCVLALYDIDEATARRDVQAFVSALLDQQLMRPNP
jgi:Coenzyme PQQ synthesis protein D (PqqD)